MSKHTLC